MEDIRRPPRTLSGWVTFAGVAALIVGLYNLFSGLAALADDESLNAVVNEVLFSIDLTAWGWFWLLVGVLQIVTGVLILGRSPWGLASGVGIASLSAFMTIFVMFIFPRVGDRDPRDRHADPVRAAEPGRGVWGLATCRDDVRAQQAAMDLRWRHGAAGFESRCL